MYTCTVRSRLIRIAYLIVFQNGKADGSRRGKYEDVPKLIDVDLALPYGLIHNIVILMSHV